MTRSVFERSPQERRDRVLIEFVAEGAERYFVLPRRLPDGCNECRRHRRRRNVTSDRRGAQRSSLGSHGRRKESNADESFSTRATAAVTPRMTARVEARGESHGREHTGVACRKVK